MAAVELYETSLRLDAALKAYYRFSSGALNVDTIGGHNGSAISDPAEDASGKFAGACAFDGNDAYAMDDHADFKPTGVFSVSFWIKLAGGGTYGLVSAAGNIGGGAGGWCILIVGGKLYFQVVSTSIQSAASINTSAWVHCVCVWDGSYLRTYVNGAASGSPVACASIGYGTTTYPRLGCHNSVGTNQSFLIGSLDDVAIFNGKALSATEIDDLYNGELPAASLFKTWNGLAKANLKTWNGLAIASLKNWNGLA